MAVKFTVPTIFTAVDKGVIRLVKAMGKGVGKFAAKTEVAMARASRAMRKLTAPLRFLKRQIGSLGLFIGGAALFGAVVASIGIFADFEQANANLSAVMGVTVQQNKVLAADAQRLGSITAKTASEVVGLQTAFARLGFTQKEILNVTEATIAGSVGMNAELSDTANLVGAMVRTFDKFSSVDAPEIIDQMTLATQKSALNFEKLSTALPIVSGAANASGVSFTKVGALLGTLSDAGIDASMSATSLRNIFIESAKRGVPFEKLLLKVSKSTNKLSLANKLFGKRGAVAAVILSKNIDKTEKLDKTLRSAAAGQELSGVAAEAAAKQLNTLKGDITLLKSAFAGMILSTEDGTGSFNEFLRTTTQTVTEIFKMASGTETATEKLTEKEKRIREIATESIKWIKIIGKIVGAIIALKAIIFIVNAGLAIYKAGIFAVAVATKLWTAGQWLLNAALTANPIGIIIVAIAALIAIVVLAIKKYDEWGAAVLLFLGPIGLTINLIQAFRRNWDQVVKAFKTEGIIAGFKKIGAVIIDSLLFPIQQLFKLIGKIPGLGGFSENIVGKIGALRERLGVSTDPQTGGTAVGGVANLDAARNESINRSITERTESQNVNIQIKDQTGRADVDTDGGNIPILLTSTFNESELFNQ